MGIWHPPNVIHLACPEHGMVAWTYIPAFSWYTCERGRECGYVVCEEGLTPDGAELTRVSTGLLP